MDFVGAGSSEGGTAPALPLPSSATEPAPSILFPSGKLCPKPWGLEKYLRRTSSCIKTAPSQRCREHSPEFPKHGPLYVINCPIRCSSPGQPGEKHFWGATSPAPNSQTLSHVWDQCPNPSLLREIRTWGGKIKDAQHSADSQEPPNSSILYQNAQNHAWTI